jgi:hypothetical protein
MTDVNDRAGGAEPGDLGRLFLQRAGAGDVDGVAALCEPLAGAATRCTPVAGEQRHE